MADDTLKRFAGGLLLAIGAVIGCLGGLCTLGFVGFIIFTAASAHHNQTASSGAVTGLLLSLFVGAIPMGIGAGLFMLGLHLRRPNGARDL